MSNQQRFIVIEDPWLGGFAVYDRATRMYAYGHKDTVDTIYEDVTSNPDNAKHWGWMDDGPFRHIKDMFEP